MVSAMHDLQVAFRWGSGLALALPTGGSSPGLALQLTRLPWHCSNASVPPSVSLQACDKINWDREDSVKAVDGEVLYDDDIKDVIDPKWRIRQDRWSLEHNRPAEVQSKLLAEGLTAATSPAASPRSAADEEGAQAEPGAYEPPVQTSAE